MACKLGCPNNELGNPNTRVEVVCRPELSTLVFRLADASDEANLQAREALLAAGSAVIAMTRVDGRQYLKFTLLNPDTTLRDIAEVLDPIAAHVPLEAAA